MLVRMGPEVVAVFPQRSYDVGEFSVAIEISSEEKGRFDSMLLQHTADELTSVSKLVTGEDQVDFLL